MSYPFLQARWFARGHNTPVNRLVIHRMEAPEKGETAEAVARYFATTERPSSCHYNVDNNSIVQSVRESDRAFHAPPNSNSLGIEHAGYSAQDTWSTPYGHSMLRLSARLAAEICLRHKLPVVWLEPADLVAGKRGITSHRNVSVAWQRSKHWDPGPHFPIPRYLQLVRDAMHVLARNTEEFDVRPNDITSALRQPGGGLWKQTAEGGIYAYGLDGKPGGEFFGAYTGHKDLQNVPRVFLALVPCSHGGYVQVAHEGSTYEWCPTNRG